MMKYKKGTDEEADSFDDQLDTHDEVKDSCNEEVESTDKEGDTSDEDFEQELNKKSNSKEKLNLLPPLLSKPESLSFTHFCSRVMENQSDVQNHSVKIQADDHDLLVNSNNKNDDMLGYESKKYSDAEDAVGTNHLDQKLVKRGITRLHKFCSEYGKLDGIKIKVTFDALNRESGLHRAVFLSFLGDMVREHIGLKILSWKKEKSARGKMMRSKNVYHHKMGRDGFVFVKKKMIKNKEIKADEEPLHGIMWLKGRVNKDREFPDDEIRSVGDKL
nr:hypothetical protein [Tanacetum cinerariifolium]